MNRNKLLARHLVETFSGISTLAALFIALSPFAFNYPRSSGRAAIDLALGGIIASLALSRVLGSYDARTISAVNMLLALFTLIVPWLMHDTQFSAFFLTHLSCGITIFVSSAISLCISHLFRPIEIHPWLQS